MRLWVSITQQGMRISLLRTSWAPQPSLGDSVMLIQSTNPTGWCGWWCPQKSVDLASGFWSAYPVILQLALRIEAAIPFPIPTIFSGCPPTHAVTQAASIRVLAAPGAGWLSLWIPLQGSPRNLPHSLIACLSSQTIPNTPPQFGWQSILSFYQRKVTNSRKKQYMILQ